MRSTCDTGAEGGIRGNKKRVVKKKVDIRDLHDLWKEGEEAGGRDDRERLT